MHIARQLGEPLPIAAGRHRPPLRPLPERLRPGPAARRSHAHDSRPDDARGLVPHRQPGPVRRGDPAPGRRAVARDRRAARWPARRCRSGSSGSRCSPTPDAIRRVVPRGQRRRRVRRRRSPGCTPSPRPRCGSPGSTCCASRCCTCTRRPTSHCRGPTIDMDFMNLNQAAHGDREFGYIQTRLRHRPQDRRRPRQRPGRRRAASTRGCAPRSGRARAAQRCGWPASATTCATSPSPRATRSRPSCGSASRSTPTASTTWSRRSTPSPTRTSTTLVEEYDDAYRRRPRTAPGRRPARVAALRGPASKLGLRDVPRPTAASTPSPPTSRTSAACASCPGSPCSA